VCKEMRFDCRYNINGVRGAGRICSSCYRRSRYSERCDRCRKKCFPPDLTANPMELEYDLWCTKCHNEWNHWFFMDYEEFVKL
jgi:hypothetical protein